MKTFCKVEYNIKGSENLISTYFQFFGSDTVISVRDEGLAGNGAGFPNL